MAHPRSLMSGRLLLSLVAVFTAVSPFLADWNATHIYNPRWPPHALFHNAQTMTLGALLGIATLAFTWLGSSQPPRVALVAAAVFASLYWISQGIAFGFPGVGWTDPNLLPPGKTMTDLPIQLPLILVVPMVTLLGLLLALRGSTPSKPGI